MSQDFTDNRNCFICGERNPHGLKLVLRLDAERGEARADVVFPERFQGWEKVVHGGLLAAVLDEGMIYAAGSKGLKCVTGEMTVRFVKPARTEAAYRLRGRLTGERKGRIVFAESEITDETGETLARATGKLFLIAA